MAEVPETEAPEGETFAGEFEFGNQVSLEATALPRGPVADVGVTLNQGRTHALSQSLKLGMLVGPNCMEGYTDSVHDACRRSDVLSVINQIRMGADINRRDQSGFSALHISARLGDVATGIVLVEAKADVNATSIVSSIAPIHRAAAHGRLSFVELLLDHQADLAKPNNYGWTALHFAAHNGHLDCVDLLLQQQEMDSLQKTTAGETADDLAMTQEVRELLRVRAEFEADEVAEQRARDAQRFVPIFARQVQLKQQAGSPLRQPLEPELSTRANTRERK